MVSAERLEIRLLGPLEVLRGGQNWPLPQSRKTRALLAYFAVTQRQHLRQHLCSLLWEGPADPRAALRWSLTKLRAVTDDAQTKRLRGTQELIGFDAAHVDIDLWRLRHQLGKDHQQAPLPALDAAASMFRGDLLEGLDLPDCPSFDAWLKAEREAAEHLRDSILATLADRSRGTPETALTLRASGS
jgi:DNA-binding SARP family transcriptional activator